jgi:hypothetical protein
VTFIDPSIAPLNKPPIPYTIIQLIKLNWQALKPCRIFMLLFWYWTTPKAPSNHGQMSQVINKLYCWHIYQGTVLLVSVAIWFLNALNRVTGGQKSTHISWIPETSLLVKSSGFGSAISYSIITEQGQLSLRWLHL